MKMASGDHKDNIPPSLGYNESMPTVKRVGPYRIYFYSHEQNEPPHVHVDRDELSAKFWLQPVGLARNYGFRPRELRELFLIVERYQQELLETWNEYFGRGSR
jgi:Domain of unknown function (DUF4160)